MLAKLAYANFAAKPTDVNLLNSVVVIYLPWKGILFSTAVSVVGIVKLVILGILFLTLFIIALRAVVVANLVMLGISFLTSFISALGVALVAKLVISGILFSIFLILALYTSFLITSFF